MANDVYTTGSNCSACARNRVELKLKRRIQLFPASGPLEFIAIDILGPLPRTVNGNQLVVVMTVRYSQLTRALPSDETSSVHVENVFIDSWIVLYGILSYVLTYTEVKFTSKLFAVLCTMLRVKHQTTTACHPQTNGRVERYDRTIVSRLRNYDAENQRDWDKYVQPSHIRVKHAGAQVYKYDPF